jgi:hypothetical protein
MHLEFGLANEAVKSEVMRYVHDCEEEDECDEDQYAGENPAAESRPGGAATGVIASVIAIIASRSGYEIVFGFAGVEWEIHVEQLIDCLSFVEGGDGGEGMRCE